PGRPGGGVGAHQPDPERPGQSAAGIDGPVQGVGFVRRPVVRRAPGVVPAAACISTTGLRVTSPRRADSAFLSAAGRPTAATPGGQERRCPPYGSSAGSTGDTLPPGECRADSAFLSAAWRSTAATPGGQERRCPPYGSSAESTGDTLPSANVGRTALS